MLHIKQLTTKYIQSTSFLIIKNLIYQSTVIKSTFYHLMSPSKGQSLSLDILDWKSEDNKSLLFGPKHNIVEKCSKDPVTSVLLPWLPAV